MQSTWKNIYNSSSLSKDLVSQSVLNYPAFSPPNPYDIMTRYILPQQNPFLSHATSLQTHTHTHTHRDRMTSMPISALRVLKWFTLHSASWAQYSTQRKIKSLPSQSPTSRQREDPWENSYNARQNIGRC